MKKQYLTSTQKEVLLKICRAMFPEIPSEKIIWYSDENEKRITIDHSEECEEFIVFNAYPAEHTATKRWDTVSIHWSELCITKLGIRILGLNNKLNLLKIVFDHMTDERHIVDSLYEQFKKR